MHPGDKEKMRCKAKVSKITDSGFNRSRCEGAWSNLVTTYVTNSSKGAPPIANEKYEKNIVTFNTFSVK